MAAPLLPTSALRADVLARALDARDVRFDGAFFVGITTTRIYCRPVCPARVSDHSRRRFFVSAAAAERAGFRPCLRCRPELAPGRARVDALSRLAHAAAQRIAAGALNGRRVADLARDLGVSERHLRRALEEEVGASPLELAQTHRLLLAKRLLADTVLPVTQVAYASGFQSLRRFNTTFREQYRMSPSALRRVAPVRRRTSDDPSEDTPLRLTLAYRPPFAWAALLAFLGREAVEGAELVSGGRYARTIEIDGRRGVVCVEDAGRPAGGRPAPRGRPGGAPSRARTHLNVDVSPSLVPVLMPLLARFRHLLDLDAEPAAIDAHLASSGLGALVERCPGMRLPGAIDGFDIVLRVLLGRRAAGRVAHAVGTPFQSAQAGLDRILPDAGRVVEAGPARLARLGVPRRRAEALALIARQVADGALRLEHGSSIAATRRALSEVSGVGKRTASAIVMRALDWPDAFPAEDRALQRAAGVTTARALLARAEPWRPWRAYAALHLWARHGVDTRGVAFEENRRSSV